MSNPNDIRGTWKTIWGGRVAGGLIWVLGRTMRIEISGWRPEYEDTQFIHAFWHNRICALLVPWTTRFRKRCRNSVVLSSASKDGAAIEAAVGVFGVGAVRGSSSRRGAAALIALKRAAKEGKDLIVTPDGPRGPCYSMQPGVIKLAQTTGLKILPISVIVDDFWRLETWDRFIVPKPFSRLRITLGTPYEVSRKLDQAGFDAARVELESILRDGVDDLPDDHADNH
ncbi:MAG: lysophospholipid acyltransferase family protein [Verrucomicrobiaceae bacterium]